MKVKELRKNAIYEWIIIDRERGYKSLDNVNNFRTDLAHHKDVENIIVRRGDGDYKVIEDWQELSKA